MGAAAAALASPRAGADSDCIKRHLAHAMRISTCSSPKSAVTAVEPSASYRDHSLELRSRQWLGEPYPVETLPHGRSGPVVYGSSVASTTLQRDYMDWHREERWLKRALADRAVCQVSDAAADRARSLLLDASAHPAPKRSWYWSGSFPEVASGKHALAI